MKYLELEGERFFSGRAPSVVKRGKKHSVMDEPKCLGHRLASGDGGHQIRSAIGLGIEK